MIEKAIKFFEDEIRRLELAPELNGCEMTEEWTEQIEICKTAKTALEKQIPKKPIIKKSCKVNAFALRCPNCEAVLQSDSPHCRYCGQALDWSDTE